MIVSVFVVVNPDERSDQFDGDSKSFERNSIPFGGAIFHDAQSSQ